MTTIAREWRLRIHDAGTTTPTDLTVAHTFAAEIEDPPQVGGQTVRVLDGRSESQPWQVKLVDASGAVTAVLGDANDRAQLGYRIADISKRDDGGAWDILATGRIAGITLDDVAGYLVAVSDERVIERNTTLWKGAGGTTAIWWPGFVAGSYGPFVTPPFAAFVSSVTRVTWRKGSRIGDSTFMLSSIKLLSGESAGPLLQTIEDDVKEEAGETVSLASAAAGSYRNIRLQLDGELGNRELVGFGEAAPAGSAVRTGRGGLLTSFPGVWVYDPLNDLPAEDTGFVYMPGADPTDEVPLHIESRPGDLLQAIYDGTYSGSIAVRYDSAAMTTLKNRLQADGIGSLRWRITGTEKMSTWLEDHFYKPLGVVPLIGNDGALKPVKVFPTQTEISDTGTLHEFTESNCRLLDWRYGAEDAVSLVRATYPHESQPSEAEERDSLDTLEESDHDHEESHDTVSDADRVLEIALRGWHDSARVEAFMKLRSREVFEMFGDGPLYISVWGGSDSESVEAGDYVIVTHSAMPSPTGSRGDSRICFVLSRTALANGFNFDLVEVGPSAQALAAPTVSVAQAGDGATVTITNLPAGAFWELRMHDGDSVSAPSDTDTGWRTVATGSTATHTIAKIKHGVKVWFQARSRQEGRIASAWSVADDLTITALTAPTALALDTLGGVLVTATFTPGEATLPTEVHLDGDLQFWLPAGSTRFRLLGLETSTTYNSPGLQVRHIDPQTGATSAFDTVTFTTLSVAETAPTFDAAVLLIGEAG